MIHLAYKVWSIDSLANNPSLTNLPPKTQIFDMIVSANITLDQICLAIGIRGGAVFHIKSISSGVNP